MPKLTGGRIAEDTLWACTTCGACQEVCPVFIEHPVKIIQMRQNLVLEQEKTPPELQRTFRNIERQSNPWGIGNDQRMDWAKGLNVPTIEDHADPEYILWVGCAGAFDSRIVKQTRAMIKVLETAGVDYAVLGHQEACTGDPARRAGNEMLFQQLAEQNVATLKSVNAKKIVTSCPHCLHTLRHDYPQFGGSIDPGSVIHHTQLIDHLFKEGKLVAERSPVDTITYHDSCYLGRWNREFDAPRDVIRAVVGAPGGDFAVREMTRSRRHGFCCGAGGARMFMEEHDGVRVNLDRTDEVIATGASAVAVACPFCNIMLTDGMKQRNVDDKIAVLDVAELVAASIPDVPIDRLVRKRGAQGPEER
jgi:Fe-S oxidoreductase